MQKLTSRRKLKTSKIQTESDLKAKNDYYKEFELLLQANTEQIKKDKEDALEVRYNRDLELFELIDKTKYNCKLYSFGNWRESTEGKTYSFTKEEYYYLNDITLLKCDSNIISLLESTYELNRCLVYSYLRRSGKVISIQSDYFTIFENYEDYKANKASSLVFTSLSEDISNIDQIKPILKLQEELKIPTLIAFVKQKNITFIEIENFNY